MSIDSLLGNLTDTAAPIEIVWSLLALLGVLFAIRHVGRAAGDLRWACAVSAEPATLLVARQNLRHQFSRFAKLVICLGVGVAAMLTPTPIESPTVPSMFVTITAVALLTMEAIMVFDTLMDYRDRRKLLGRPRRRKGD